MSAITAEELARRTCVPCRGDTPPLTSEEIALLLPAAPGWQVDGEGHLRKRFRFTDFATALAYVNRLGAMAEEQDHHPNLALSWGRVEVRIWTHAISGLSENDFIFAAKANALA